MIPFTGFLPDADPSTPGLISSCLDMIPTTKGMKAMPSFVSVGLPALSAACLGAAVITKLDGTNRFFAGTETKLYEGGSSSYTDVSRAGDYTTGDIRWRFTQFGNTSIAANKVDILQFSATGDFADITSSPKAETLDASSGFVMLGGVDLGGGAGFEADRWICSAYLDHTDWVPSVVTQCTTGRLVDSPGPIRAMKALGSNFVAYKDRAVFLGTYVGAPGVFQWIQMPGEIGTFSQESVVSIITAHLFIGEADIYAFDGSRPTPIGGGIKEWFFANINKLYRHRIIGMHERKESRVWWFFPKGSSSTLNAAIVYNYAVGKWGYIEQNIECPVEYVSAGLTFDGLGALFATYNDFPDVAYDSPYWLATSSMPAVINTSHVLQSITGISAGGSITTGNIGDDTQWTLLDRSRPRFDVSPTTATMTNSYSDTDGVTFTTDETVSISNGNFDVLRASRWHKLTYTFTGDCEAIGHTITLKPDGLE